MTNSNLLKALTISSAGNRSFNTVAMNFKQLHRMIIDQMVFRKCFYRLRIYVLLFRKTCFFTINVKIMFVVISFKKANALCG